MAHYLVRARPTDLAALRRQLDNNTIANIRPYGSEMQQCLSNARITPDGWAVWEETCYCTPPLHQERAVLDQHFDAITTESVDQGQGWAKISDLRPLWSSQFL